MQGRLEGAVLEAQQRAALRATVLERRLEATSSQLALVQQASVASTSAGQAPSTTASAAGHRSRAASVKPALGGGGAELGAGGSRRATQRVRGPTDWVATMLAAALHTPLPDPDADMLEDDAPAQLLEQIAELEAADAELAGAMPAQETALKQAERLTGAGEVVEPLAALEAKLSQAALGAQEALAIALQARQAGGTGDLRIPAHRPGTPL